MSKLKGSMLWGGIIGLAVAAFLLAIYSTDDAFQDMATNAFGGVVVGIVVILYEQFREEKREDVQFERDRALAKKIRDDANIESDRRSLADYFLTVLQPKWAQLHRDMANEGYTQTSSLVEGFKKITNIGAKYISRVDDEELDVLWRQFVDEVETFSTNRTMSQRAAQRTSFNPETSKHQVDENIKSLSCRAERLLAILNRSE